MKIIVSLYDRKGELFNTPWVTLNELTAEREFVNLVAKSDTLLCTNPEDFILYKIATFDEQNGKVNGLDKHIELKNGLLVKRDIKNFIGEFAKAKVEVIK